MRRDRVIYVLLGCLFVDTVVAMSSALRESPNVGSPSPLRVWSALVWFALLLTVVVTGLARLRALRSALAARDERIATVEAAARDWLWEASPDLVATYCSPSLSALLGLAPWQVIGTSMFDFVDDEDLPRARAVLAAALRDGHGWDEVDLRWKHADGRRVRMVGSAQPIVDERGSLVGFRGARGLAASSTEAEQRLVAIRHRVESALAEGPIQIALQPTFSATSGALTCVEALARFPDNRAPDLWFAEAHEVGLGVELELAALDAALRLNPGLGDHVELAVNASPGLILDPRLAERLSQPDVWLERLTVEITEHAAVANYDDIRAALLPLRERGLKLAVDDTGAGYASFAHVLSLKPDTIKLDRSLVGNIDRDPARRAVITAVVLLALELGASVTAEGIETVDELDTVTSLGVDHAQGYLFARPALDRNRWQSWLKPRLAAAAPAPATVAARGRATLTI